MNLFLLCFFRKNGRGLGTEKGLVADRLQVWLQMGEQSSAVERKYVTSIIYNHVDQQEITIAWWFCISYDLFHIHIPVLLLFHAVYTIHFLIQVKVTYFLSSEAPLHRESATDTLDKTCVIEEKAICQAVIYE